MARRPKKCGICGAEFTPNSPTQKYCFGCGRTPEERRRTKLERDSSARAARLAQIRKNRALRKSSMPPEQIAELSRKNTERATRNRAKRKLEKPETVRTQRQSQSLRYNERAKTDPAKRAMLTEKSRRYRDRLKQSPQKWEAYLHAHRERRRVAALNQLMKRMTNDDQSND